MRAINKKGPPFGEPAEHYVCGLRQELMESNRGAANGFGPDWVWGAKDCHTCSVACIVIAEREWRLDKRFHSEGY